MIKLLWCRKKNLEAVHGCKKTEMEEKMTRGEFNDIHSEKVLVMQWKQHDWGMRRPGFALGSSADLLSHVDYVCLFVCLFCL